VTFGSLFAGIGGFDLGFERAGMECRWQVEIDPFCQRVLAKHWPTVRRHEDVRTFPPTEPDEWRVDVICGGFPCQPFSSASAGRCRGRADDRWLWPEMRRVVETLRPRWFIGENVTHLDGPALGQVVSDLEASGYEVGPPLEVPACAFGYDHKRPRLWILGHTDRHGQSSVPVDAEVAWVPGGGGLPGSMGATDGVPSRMDRLAALGNSIVPDIAEWIGRLIGAADARSECR
jgi:DNA (cytosine-5)-methyltransferase 1